MPKLIASRRIVTTFAVVASFAALAVLLFALSVRAVPGNSDGATVVLEGQTIRAGHLALGGWYLSYDSFWLSDALVNALADVVVGVRGVLVNAVPAVIAAGVVVLGAALARRGRTGASAVVGVLVVVGLLALPSYALSVFFLQGPLHVGTALWCLGAMALLQPPLGSSTRLGPGRLSSSAPSWWRWGLAVVLLAASADGDLQAVAFGAAPIAFAGVIAAARRRDVWAGVPGVGAGGAGVVLALIVREIGKAVGTFVVNAADPTAHGHQLVTNLGTSLRYLRSLLGFSTRGFGAGGVPSELSDVHIVGVLLVAVVVVVSAVRLVFGVVRGTRTRAHAREAVNVSAEHEPWRLDDMLLLAFFASIAVFVDLTPTTNVSYSRYLTAAVIFGTVLAGRVVARIVPAVIAAPGVRSLRGRVLATLAAATLACFAAGTGFNLAQSPAVQPTDQLAQFLEAHDLHLGIGDYWSSSIVTVESGEHVDVRPVTSLLTGKITVYTRNSERSWYHGTKFQFFVYNPALPFGNVDEQTAIKTYGRPIHRYIADGYIVLVWAHLLRVSYS